MITAFAVGIDWSSVLRDTLTPSVPRGSDGWAMIVAILARRSAPICFGRRRRKSRKRSSWGAKCWSSRLGATQKEARRPTSRCGAGQPFFSNLIAFFIILTHAGHPAPPRRHAHRDDLAKPPSRSGPWQAGFAATLYTVGILGVGLLAIPTLTGSAAYALAETLGWQEGLNRRFGDAKYFYGVVIFFDCAREFVLDFCAGKPSPSAVSATAVINGLLAPLSYCSASCWLRRTASWMQGQPASVLSRVVVGATALLMVLAAIGMFVF